MNLNEALEKYNSVVIQWLDQSKKETAAVQKLQKAVDTGNVRDIERLRSAARAASDAAYQRADECDLFDFDTDAYLGDPGRFIADLEVVAQKNGVRLSERDGVIYCYPVTLKTEPELGAVRIGKALNPNIRPEHLIGVLKKLQSKEPKAKPERFLESLYEAYELVRAKRQIDAHIALPLVQLYDVLTLLPGSSNEYTLLDFTRDLYFLDRSENRTTKKGYRCDMTHSTGSREKSAKVLKFVTRDGHEKEFSSVVFTAPMRED